MLGTRGRSGFRSTQVEECSLWVRWVLSQIQGRRCGPGAGKGSRAGRKEGTCLAAWARLEGWDMRVWDDGQYNFCLRHLASLRPT